MGTTLVGEMNGRRIPVVAGVDPVLKVIRAGDYYGPVTGFSAPNPAVFFLLPIARDAGVHHEARSLRHVQMPPHIFTEEQDGSLTIRDSILSRWSDGTGQWHGYLTKGEWSEC